MPSTTTWPCCVGDHLRLDMARAVEELLDEALAAAEGGDRLAHGRLEELRHLVHAPGDLEAAPAAAEGGLDGDRQAVLLGEGEDLRRVADRPGRAGDQRRADLAARCGAPGPCRPAPRWPAGGGPIQIRPAPITARAKPAFSDRKP